MTSTQRIAALVTTVAVFVCTIALIGGCGGSHSPSGLADAALAPANTPEEEAAVEKAVNELGSLSPNEPGVKENLRKVVEKSDKPRIRALAMQALGSMDDFDSGPLLIKGLSSDDKKERGQAYFAISKIIGTSFRFPIDDPDADNRKAGIEDITKTYEFLKAHPEHLEKMKASRAGK
jgi:hypothetical protein